MLSVHCMLNNNDYSRDKMGTYSPSTTHQHRSPMLDITSLLCHDNDNEDLNSTSTITTPSLSGASSPLSTNSSLSINTVMTGCLNYHPLTAPSTRSLSLPPQPQPSLSSSSSSSSQSLLLQQPSYQKQNLSYKHDFYTKHGVSYVPAISYPTEEQHHQQQPYARTPHYYQHRLLLLVDDDNHGGLQRRHRRDIFKQHDGDTTDEDPDDDENNDKRIKTKRRRANNKQLQVLNRVFQHTFFPSTQMRVQLGRQLGMNPRTVQIWFQNRRQALRTKERQRWSI